MVIRKTSLYIICITLCVLITSSIPQGSIAQPPPAELRELKIGDKVPNYLIENIINQNDRHIDFKELLKDKDLLILNFWATWCAPCLTELTLLDSLRQLYPDTFDVLSVTYQSEKEVKHFLSRDRNSNVKTDNLTIAVGDTVFNQLFPHKFIPHNIWIDSLGYIRAITSTKELTSENITGFYSNYKTFQLKQDRMNFKPRAPFSLGDNIYEYRSIITPRIDGISAGMMGGKLGGYDRRYFGWNVIITQFFWAAYSGFNNHMRYDLIEIETTDSLKFYWPINDKAHLLAGSNYKDYNDWRESNTFCYDLVLPKEVHDTVIREYIFNDLERSFNVKADIIEKEVECWLIEYDASTPNLPISEKPGYIYMKDYKIIMQGITMYDLTCYLSDFSPNVRPFVNLVDFDTSKKFDLMLDIPVDEWQNGISIGAVMKELEKYGFRFRKSLWNYPILRLTDLN